MPPPIPYDCDEVVRAALAPRMVAKGVDPKVISPAQAVAKFTNDDLGDDTHPLTLSMGRCDLLPSKEAVHNFGCRVAHVATEYKRAHASKALRRPKDTTHYCGSYWLSTAEVLLVESEAFLLSLEQTPYPDLAEHCDVVLRRKDMDLSAPEFDFSLTEVIAQLRLCLRNPAPHICECDTDIADYLSSISLMPNPPDIVEAPAPLQLADAK